MNRNLTIIALSLFTWGLGEGMFFNFQPIYLAKLGSDPQQIGFILGAFGAAMAITHIPAGFLADRIGRRPLLITAWLIGFLSTLAMAIANTLPVFVVGMLFYGFTAFVSSPLASYVTAARGEWTVGRALTLTTAAFSFGMILGPVTGGWIGEQYSLRTVYFVAAAIFAASNVIIFFIHPQPLDHHDPENPPVGLLSNARFMGFVAMMSFAVFAMYIAQPLTPNFLETVQGLSLTQIGWIFTAGAAGNFLLAVGLGSMNPRWGYMIAQISVAFFALLLWLGADFRLFLLGYFLLGGFRAARPLASAQARALVHDSQMGLTYGMLETVSAVIFILTPPLAGFLYERDPFLVYPLSLGLVAASLLLTFFYSRRIHA